VIEPRKTLVGAFVLDAAGAVQKYYTDLAFLSDRGLRAEQMHKRFPRNLGETVTSIFNARRGLRVINFRLHMTLTLPLCRTPLDS